MCTENRQEVHFEKKRWCFERRRRGVGGGMVVSLLINGNFLRFSDDLNPHEQKDHLRLNPALFDVSRRGWAGNHSQDDIFILLFIASS